MKKINIANGLFDLNIKENYCPICGEPLFQDVELEPNLVRRFPRKCSCIKNAELKQQQRENKIKQQARIDYNREDCFSTKRFKGYTFENCGFKDKNTDVLKKYVNRFSEIKAVGGSIVLSGGLGTGKTYYACCVANALIDKGYKCKFTSLNEILEISSSFDDSVKRFFNYDLLIIDDVGTARNTSFSYEKIFNFIDTLNREQIPCIFTTNLSKQDMSQHENLELGRINDRILEMSVFLTFEGEKRPKTNKTLLNILKN